MIFIKFKFVYVAQNNFVFTWYFSDENVNNVVEIKLSSVGYVDKLCVGKYTVPEKSFEGPDFSLLIMM